EELQRYGFPPRPSSGEGLKEWRGLVGGYRETRAAHGVPRPSGPRPGRSARRGGEGLGYGQLVRVCRVQCQKPDRMARRHRDLLPAGKLLPSCKPSARVADWVGLGGFNTGRFIQTGTEVDTYGN